MNLRYILALSCLCFLFLRCETDINGESPQNMPPETFTVVNNIERTGNDRLESQVELQWWADDADGVVKGYEYSFSNENPITDWQFTTATDSIFLLSTPVGTDSVDIKFSIRAIDNLDLADPVPAELILPIKNSPPSVSFVNQENIPGINFPVFKISWEGFDADGLENISNFEIALNDTLQNIYAIPQNVNSITFEAENPEDLVSDAFVFFNNSTNSESEKISALALNDTNFVYIRAIDKSGSTSAFVKSKALFVKQKKSDILFVNAYQFNSETITQFYIDNLNEIGFTEVDKIDILELDSYGYFTQQSNDVLTQSRVFNLFETIVWYSNSADFSLNLAQKTTFDFFSKGGKMFMSVYISSAFDEQSDFFDFTPISSLIEPNDTTFILADTSKVVNAASDYPELLSSGFVPVVKPFNLDPGSSVLYNADLIARHLPSNTFHNWNGTSAVIAKKTDINGVTNFVFSALEIQNLNGNSNINEFFNKVFVDEFGL